MWIGPSLVLPLITFGRVCVQPISSSETGFNWLGFKRAPDGPLICEATMAGWIGLVPWMLGLIVLIVTIT